MFYCRECKNETPGSTCKFCSSTNTYKLWWTFPSTTHGKAGVRIYYDEDGKELRRVEY